MAGQIRQERGERIALRVCSRSGNGTDHRKRGEPIRSALPVRFCSGGWMETSVSSDRRRQGTGGCGPGCRNYMSAGSSGPESCGGSRTEFFRERVLRSEVGPFGGCPLSSVHAEVMRYYLCRLCLLPSMHFCVRLKPRRGAEGHWVCVCGCGRGDGRRSRKMLPNLRYIERGA